MQTILNCYYYIAIIWRKSVNNPQRHNPEKANSQSQKYSSNNDCLSKWGCPHYYQVYFSFTCCIRPTHNIFHVSTYIWEVYFIILMIDHSVRNEKSNFRVI